MFLSEWQINPWLTGWLCLVLGVYLRGFLPRMRKGASAFRPWRACLFVAGIFCFWIAVSSPLDSLGGYLLSVHMTQHLVLIMVVPPLVLAGNPGLPLMMGLPRSIRRNWIEPLLASSSVRKGFARVTSPVVGWVSLVLVTWVWHVPFLYELALVNARWHVFEHLCFTVAAFLFWWPVVQPYPIRVGFPRWVLIAYLLTADIQNTIFSALFCFSERVLYPTYAATSPAIGVDPLADQALAGAIMWVPGGIAFLVPVGVICAEMFDSRRPASVRKRQRIAARARSHTSGAESAGEVSAQMAIPDESVSSPSHGVESHSGHVISLPQLGSTGMTSGSGALDLGDIPLVGAYLRSRNARLFLRTLMLVLAGCIVADGFLGPSNEAMNAAGVLPFTHWRGVLVLSLLVVGNVFCSICPFVVPRMVGRRLFGGGLGLSWPRHLRNKWGAVIIVFGWLWAYEALALWASPLGTAWIILGYFMVGFAIDMVFRGASFCKWVCPIGQFNFINSMISPVEIGPKDPNVCDGCATRECVKGNGRIEGCGLSLFIPTKVGNLDCTGCLDCADACPHGNVGVLTRDRGFDLIASGWRSSIGRIGRRTDLSILVLLLVFGAFVNAAGMVGPMLFWQDEMVFRLDLQSRLIPATLLVVGLLVVVPFFMVGIGAWLSGWLGKARGVTPGDAMRRLAYGLVPMGAAMWIVHFGFHLATSAGTGVSVIQRMGRDLGFEFMGTPEWVWGCCLTPPDWLLPMEITALNIGLVSSLAVVWRIAFQMVSGSGVMRVAMPWLLMVSVLYLCGLWLILQPMDMRGTVL